MAIKQVNVVELQSGKRAVNGFEQIFAVKRIALVGAFMQPPEQFGRHQETAAAPAEFPESRAHELLGLTSRIGLCIIEEIDPGIVGSRHHASDVSNIGLGVKSDP